MRVDLWKDQRDQAEDLGSAKVLRKDGRTGEPVVMIWRPRATKPCAHYRFKSTEEREAFVDKFMERRNEQEAAKVVAREERKAYKHSVKVGDIFMCSWGYDQTNIDYYKVVSATAKTVSIRQLQSYLVNGEEGFMTGRSMPLVDEWHKRNEKVSRHIVGKGYKDVPAISLSSFESASLWDGKAHRCSWYA